MPLDLDDRQRAMLHEMGVHVWWPAPASAPVAPQAVVQADPNTIESIAAHAVSAGVRGPKSLKAEPLPQAQPSAPPPPPSPSLRVAATLADLATPDWPLLAQTVAQCQACALAQGRRAPVFGAADTPQRANWLLVGEPPDEAEERLGRPLVEAAGQLLDNMLKAVGVSRVLGADPAESAYVTNAVKCRPAPARNPQGDELAVCEQYLRREVALVQPKVIVALGRYAAQALLQTGYPELATMPLGKLRGSVYRYQGVAVVVTYPPSYLLRTPQDKARAWADLCLALAHSRP